MMSNTFFAVLEKHKKTVFTFAQLSPEEPGPCSRLAKMNQKQTAPCSLKSNTHLCS